jgi:hypothetical protein
MTHRINRRDQPAETNRRPDSPATRRTPHVSAVRFTHNPAFDDLIEATMFLTDIAGVRVR